VGTLKPREVNPELRTLEDSDKSNVMVKNVCYTLRISDARVTASHRAGVDLP